LEQTGIVDDGCARQQPPRSRARNDRAGCGRLVEVQARASILRKTAGRRPARLADFRCPPAWTLRSCAHRHSSNCALGRQFNLQGEVTMEFEGKVAVVTGATSGIGMATARKIAEQGGKVAAVGRKADVLAKIASPNIKTYVVDLLNENDTKTFVATVLKDFGRLDILVNAAGIIATGDIENTSLANYDLMMNINVRSVFQLMQLALPS